MLYVGRASFKKPHVSHQEREDSIKQDTIPCFHCRESGSLCICDKKPIVSRASPRHQSNTIPARTYPATSYHYHYQLEHRHLENTNYSRLALQIMAESQKTDALYQRDVSLKTLETTISGVTPISDLPPNLQSLFKAPDSGVPFVVATPRTIFHAQGGGQPTDTGSISSGENAVFKVHQVRKAGPAILHMGTFSPTGATFGVGEEVKQVVDWDARVLHSRLHTAGHVLSLAIHGLSKTGVLPGDLKEVKASHYPGAAFVEFQGLVLGDKKGVMQERVDELVRQDLDVKIHFWTEEEAKQKCAVVLEGVKGGEEGVRVVEIGEIGSYPCGGTHVGSLGHLGRVVVRNIKRQKGISKISYGVADA